MSTVELSGPDSLGRCDRPRCNTAWVAGSPRELVERTTEELRTAVIREQEAIKKDPNRAIHLVDRIVSPHVDTILVSKWILGKHWRRATPEQRQQFIDAYRKLLRRIYAVRVGDYTDVEVTYLPVRTNNDKGTRVTVRTQVSHQGKSPVRIDYRLHQKELMYRPPVPLPVKSLISITDSAARTAAFAPREPGSAQHPRGPGSTRRLRARG